MSKVRVGIIGIGNMGSKHAITIDNGAINEAELSAVCDVNEAALDWATKHLNENINLYHDADSFLHSKNIDAVIIATPHYDHPGLAIKSFARGYHVLVEKPAGVYTEQVEKMNEAAKSSGKVFGIMYNQRTNPVYRKIKELVEEGELGEIKRINWIVTDWYRPQCYYDSGDWRATWSGEGGGVLINQCPHQLDLLQWICGMPKRVRAFMSFGKYHNIEVEDDVTAYMEYENGATGVFITSTAEAPGTNRLEITGDKGKIVLEDNKLAFYRLRMPERIFNQESKTGFGSPECWKCEVPVKGEITSHKGIIQDWINGISTGKKLLAPGEEGIKGLTISNAMHLSAWTDKFVEIPLSSDLYYKELMSKIQNSKKRIPLKVIDMMKSY